MTSLERVNTRMLALSLRRSLAPLLDRLFDNAVNRDTLTADVAKVCSSFVERRAIKEFSVNSFGNPAGTTLVRDAGPRPSHKKVHYAVMHYESGETDTLKVRGTYRRAKKQLRAHLANREKYLCSIQIQPFVPASSIQFNLKVGPLPS